MKPLTREQLDSMLCSTPDCNCGGTILKALCHLDAGLLVSFVASTGSIRVACSQCKKHVCDIAVASGDAEKHAMEVSVFRDESERLRVALEGLKQLASDGGLDFLVDEMRAALDGAGP